MSLTFGATLGWFGNRLQLRTLKGERGRIMYSLKGGSKWEDAY